MAGGKIRTKFGFREPGQWTFNELDARRLIAIHDAARVAVADANAVTASPHLMALSDAIATADAEYGGP